MTNCDYCKKEHYVFFLIKLYNTYQYMICYDCNEEEIRRKIGSRVPMAMTSHSASVVPIV